MSNVSLSFFILTLPAAYLLMYTYYPICSVLEIRDVYTLQYLVRKSRTV